MRLGLGLAMLLAGCAVNTAGPPDATTVTVEQRPGVTPPLARGGTQLVVRTVAATGGQEVRGATCRAETAWFTSDFASPARLLMPDYGASAPPVVVTCRADGLTGQGTAQPDAAWSGGLGGWPAVGISVGTGDAGGVGVGMGWWGGGVGTSSGTPVVRYPDLRIALQ